jgi:hypothetical protein
LGVASRRLKLEEEMSFVDSNYCDYKAILKNELRINTIISDDFYDTFILRIVPHLHKLKTKEEMYRSSKSWIAERIQAERINRLTTSKNSFR